MKRQAGERYVKRIDRVVERLNEHLQTTPTLEDLSGIAGVSPFHYHRL